MNNSKQTSLALSTALVGGLALAGSAFAMQPLAQGYLLSATEAAPKTAADKAAEGKCGMQQADTDKDGKVSRAEFVAAHADKASEFDAIDSNHDGFMDSAEHATHHKAKQADTAKSPTEGKCGEGKCGSKM